MTTQQKPSKKEQIVELLLSGYDFDKIVELSGASKSIVYSIRKDYEYATKLKLDNQRLLTENDQLKIENEMLQKKLINLVDLFASKVIPTLY